MRTEVSPESQAPLHTVDSTRSNRVADRALTRSIVSKVVLLVLLTLALLSLPPTTVLAVDALIRTVQPLSTTVVEYNFTADGSGNATGYTKETVKGILEYVELIPTDSQSSSWSVAVWRAGSVNLVSYTDYTPVMLGYSWTGGSGTTLVGYDTYPYIYAGNTDCISSSYIGIKVTGYDASERGKVRLTFGW